MLIICFNIEYNINKILIDKGRDEMNYFIVFQNKTYYEEKNGEYLWAPKVDSSGKCPFHWKNITKAKKGDIVFIKKD